MMELQVKTLHLNKSPYDNGKISGEYFREKIPVNLDYINNVLLNDGENVLYVGLKNE